MSRLKATMLGVLFFVLIICLSGCGDLVEIQERDFVMALGVSYADGQYRVTYGLPDLGKITDQPTAEQSSLLRTYEGQSLYEMEQSYNTNSEKRLDYRHLQSIILDSAICSNQQAMKNFLLQINDNYDISDNVLVYFHESELEELMGLGGVNGSIGEHLKKLNGNNYVEGMEPAKIGELVNCLANSRTLFIPEIINQDDSIAIDGGILLQENRMVKQISQAESQYYFISLGKSNEYLLRFDNEYLLRLEEIKTKLSYEMTGDGPKIDIHVSGSAEVLSGSRMDHAVIKDSFDRYIGEQIEQELADFMKRQGIDYLNLYEKSSYHNRKIWQLYENREAEFIEDVKIQVMVDIQYEQHLQK